MGLAIERLERCLPGMPVLDIFGDHLVDALAEAGAGMKCGFLGTSPET